MVEQVDLGFERCCKSVCSEIGGEGCCGAVAEVDAANIAGTARAGKGNSVRAQGLAVGGILLSNNCRGTAKWPG